MNLLMSKCALTLLMLFIFQTLVLITTSATFYSKVDTEVSDPSIKCGECPCSNTCGQPLPILSPPPLPPPPPPPPSPPPPLPPQNCDQLPRLPPPSPPPPPPPPPPRFVYVTGLPPPPRFVYVSGSPRNVNPANPFNLRVYSKAAHSSFKTAILVLYVYATFQVVVFW